MYRIKKEVIELFKEFRTNSYAKHLGIDASYVSSILNANRPCTTIIAISMISVRFDLTLRYIVDNNLLEKYFTKEK